MAESVKGIVSEASKVGEYLISDDDPEEHAQIDKSEISEKDPSLLERLDAIALNTETYLDSLTTNVSAKFESILSKAIKIIPDTTQEIALVSDRKSSLLLEMQKNPDTYKTDYSFVQDEGLVSRYREFVKLFSLNDHGYEIRSLLEDFVVLNDFYQRMGRKFQLSFSSRSSRQRDILVKIFFQSLRD